MVQAIQISGSALEQFRSYLYVLARAHLHARQQAQIEASDLVQQTLMDAHAKQDQFRGTTNGELAAWLKQILSHNLADALRHKGRAKRDATRQRPLEAAIDESFSRAEVWLAATQTSPSEHVAKKEQLLFLADAIAKLPFAQQDAVILHHLQGLSLAETAQMIERSEAAVAGLLYRGLKKLHELLEEPE